MNDNYKQFAIYIMKANDLENKIKNNPGLSDEEKEIIIESTFKVVNGCKVLTKDAEIFENLYDAIEKGKENVEEVPQEKPEEKEETPQETHEEKEEVIHDPQREQFETNIESIEAILQNLTEELKEIDIHNTVKVEEQKQRINLVKQNLAMNKAMLASYDDLVANLDILRRLNNININYQITDPQLKSILEKQISNRVEAIKLARVFIAPSIADKIIDNLNSKKITINPTLMELFENDESIKEWENRRNESKTTLEHVDSNSPEAAIVNDDIQRAEIYKLLRRASLSDTYYVSGLFKLKELNDGGIQDSIEGIARQRVQLFNKTNEALSTLNNKETSEVKKQEDVPSESVEQPVETENAPEITETASENTNEAPTVAPVVGGRGGSGGLPFPDAGFPEQKPDLIQNMQVEEAPVKRKWKVTDIKDATMELISKLSPLKLAKQIAMKVADYIKNIKEKIETMIDVYNHPYQIEIGPDGKQVLRDRKTDKIIDNNKRKEEEQAVEEPAIEETKEETKKEQPVVSFEERNITYDELFDTIKEITSSEENYEAVNKIIGKCTYIGRPAEGKNDFRERMSKKVPSDMCLVTITDPVGQFANPEDKFLMYPEKERKLIEESSDYKYSDGEVYAYIPTSIFNTIYSKREERAKEQAQQQEPPVAK